MTIPHLWLPFQGLLDNLCYCVAEPTKLLFSLPIKYMLLKHSWEISTISFWKKENLISDNLNIDNSNCIEKVLSFLPYFYESSLMSARKFRFWVKYLTLTFSFHKQRTPKCDKHWDVQIFLSKNIKRKEEKSRNSMWKMNFKGRLLLTSRDRNGRQFAFRASQKLYASKNTETGCE